MGTKGPAYTKPSARNGKFLTSPNSLLERSEAALKEGLCPAQFAERVQGFKDRTHMGRVGQVFGAQEFLATG